MSVLKVEYSQLSVTGITEPFQMLSKGTTAYIPTMQTDLNYNGLLVSSPPFNIITLNNVVDIKGNIVELNPK